MCSAFSLGSTAKAWTPKPDEYPSKHPWGEEIERVRYIAHKPGVMAKLGFGYEQCKALNADLVYCTISGFGQTGPYAKRPGFGTLAEAFAGFVYINGEPERPPLLPGFGLADSTTGLMAAYLASAALHEKRNSGKGQIIDLAIYETLFTLLGPQAIDRLDPADLLFGLQSQFPQREFLQTDQEKVVRL